MANIEVNNFIRKSIIADIFTRIYIDDYGII